MSAVSSRPACVPRSSNSSRRQRVRRHRGPRAFGGWEIAGFSPSLAISAFDTDTTCANPKLRRWGKAEWSRAREAALLAGRNVQANPRDTPPVVIVMQLRQVSWLAGRHRCLTFPTLGVSGLWRQRLAAHSCGGSSGLEQTFSPDSLRTRSGPGATVVHQPSYLRRRGCATSCAGRARGTPVFAYRGLILASICAR